MAKYRKKPVVIEAFQYDGDFMNKDGNYYIPEWGVKANLEGVLYFEDGELFVNTLEGKHHASVGDYIIKGVKGELYPCKPDIFEKTYEPADKEVIVTAKAVVDAINKSQGNIQVRESGLR